MRLQDEVRRGGSLVELLADQAQRLRAPQRRGERVDIDHPALLGPQAPSRAIQGQQLVGAAHPHGLLKQIAARDRKR